MAARQIERADARAEPNSDQEKSLNFKVSADFKKEFKGFAALQGISMTDLLKEGFALSKKRRK